MSGIIGLGPSDLILDAGGFDPNLPNGQDYELWLRMSPRMRLQILPEILGSYKLWQMWKFLMSWNDPTGDPKSSHVYDGFGLFDFPRARFREVLCSQWFLDIFAAGKEAYQSS